MTTDNLSPYPTTDKEAVPMLPEIAMEQCLARDLNMYHRIQLLAHGLVILSLLLSCLLLFLGMQQELLFFCTGITLIIEFASLCISHLYHEGVKNKERYSSLLKHSNTRSRIR